jgi:hypothetical protein
MRIELTNNQRLVHTCVPLVRCLPVWSISIPVESKFLQVIKQDGTSWIEYETQINL